MTISSNEGTEKTESLMVLKIPKQYQDFYQEQPKVGICTLMLHGRLYQMELICLKEEE